MNPKKLTIRDVVNNSELIKVFGEKSKPWFSGMREYNPIYNTTDGERMQTHGFYRESDKDRIPYAGEEHVMEVLKKLGINIEDSLEYKNMQEELKGPAGERFDLNPMLVTGKRKVVNSPENYFGKSVAPFTPEFIDYLQNISEQKAIMESKRDGSPLLAFDDSDTRKILTEKNRDVFEDFIQDVSTKAYESHTRDRNKKPSLLKRLLGR